MTYLNRVNPFNLMDSLFEASNRSADFTPPVDVEINPAKAVLKFDVPGVARDQIELQLEDGTLLVRGKREVPALEEKASYWANERRAGSFERRFRLGDEFDADKVGASLQDGVLTIEVERKAQTQPKRIEVK